MTSTTPSPSTDRRDDAKKLIGITLGLVLLVTVMLSAFVLPSHGGAPNGAPIGIVGTDAQRASSGFDPQAWDVRHYADAAALRAAIERRDVVGGIVSSAAGWQVQTAAAAGPQITAAITAVGDGAAQAAGARAVPVAVVPFPEGDPRGTGLAGAGLPLVFGGLLPVALFSKLFPGRRRIGLRVIAVATFSLITGFAVTLFLGEVSGTIDGEVLRTGLGLGLGIGALAMTQLALMTRFGYAGFGIGAAVAVLLGNPLSGLAAGPYWLPDGWAAVGQILPPGAAGSLLRANGLFDGTGATEPALILGAWLLAAVALLALVARTGRGQNEAPVAPTTA